MTYDPEANAAYVDLTPDGLAPGQSARQQHSIELPNDGELILDFDAEGRLLGLEVLHADQVLTASVLDAAPPPGSWHAGAS